MLITSHAQNMGAIAPHSGNFLTMKDALVVFCGCLQMRKVLSSTMKPRMQTVVIAHGSIETRSSMARFRVTHRPTIQATAEEEKMNKRHQFAEQKDRVTIINQIFGVIFALHTRDYSQDCDCSGGG